MKTKLRLGLGLGLRLKNEKKEITQIIELLLRQRENTRNRMFVSSLERFLAFSFRTDIIGH